MFPKHQRRTLSDSGSTCENSSDPFFFPLDEHFIDCQARRQNYRIFEETNDSCGFWICEQCRIVEMITSIRNSPLLEMYVDISFIRWIWKLKEINKNSNEFRMYSNWHCVREHALPIIRVYCQYYLIHNNVTFPSHLHIYRVHIVFVQACFANFGTLTFNKFYKSRQNVLPYLTIDVAKLSRNFLILDTPSERPFI